VRRGSNWKGRCRPRSRPRLSRSGRMPALGFVCNCIEPAERCRACHPMSRIVDVDLAGGPGQDGLLQGLCTVCRRGENWAISRRVQLGRALAVNGSSADWQSVAVRGTFWTDSESTGGKHFYRSRTTQKRHTTQAPHKGSQAGSSPFSCNQFTVPPRGSVQFPTSSQ
jgi:hypothetical protein